MRVPGIYLYRMAFSMVCITFLYGVRKRMYLVYVCTLWHFGPRYGDTE